MCARACVSTQVWVHASLASRESGCVCLCLSGCPYPHPCVHLEVPAHLLSLNAPPPLPPRKAPSLAMVLYVARKHGLV